MNHESTIHFLCASGRPHLPGIFLAQQLRKFKSKLLNYIIWFLMGGQAYRISMHCMWWICESEKMHGIGGVHVRLFLFFCVCV